MFDRSRSGTHRILISSVETVRWRIWRHAIQVENVRAIERTTLKRLDIGSTHPLKAKGIFKVFKDSGRCDFEITVLGDIGEIDACG
jgi:hypothetical protein